MIGLFLLIVILFFAAVTSSNNHTHGASQFEAGTGAAIASAVIAAIAAAIAAVSAIESRLKARREVVELQIKYFDNFRKWADASALYLTEAIHLCDLEPDRVTGETFFDRRHRLRIAISNQTDAGRWFFPNIEVDDYGAHKEPGYRGYRHEVLDGLVTAYRCLDRLDYIKPSNNELIRVELTASKRHFIGQVQHILDPARQKKEFDQIARRDA